MLAVSVIPVVSLSGQPACQVIAIPDEKAPCVGGSLGCPLTRSVFGEETCSLQADFRARFLRHRAGSQEKSNGRKRD